MNKKTRIKFRQNVRVNEKTGCWEWIGFLDHRGYGRFYNPRKQQNEPAHRFLWEFANGRKIPKGYEFHHICGNRRCVRPSHNEIIFHSRHMRLHAELGAWSGEKNSMAKLKDSQASEVRELHNKDPKAHNPKTLAKWYNICERSVYNILSFSTYTIEPTVTT